jgi:superfamily I DNA/RNA helicase
MRIAADEHVPLLEVCARAEDYPELQRASFRLRQFAALMDELRASSMLMPPDELYDLVIERTGYIKALEEKKSEKEVAALLDKYLEAQKKVNEIENAIAAKYKAVLPVEKVAKLYVAEEKFRRQQIRRLHHGGEGKPQPKN